MKYVALVCIGLVVYSYLLYPLVLVGLAALHQSLRDLAFVFRKADRRAFEDGELPEVAVIIAAYNESVHIAARLENLLALDYPPERLTVYVGSDGSRDDTADIILRHAGPRVRAFAYAENRGKASVLNSLVAETRAPVLVFSDANTMFDPAAVRRLVRRFRDPQVGGVSGELRLKSSSGDNQDGFYWRVEQLLKFLESRMGGLLGANGAIYAIRRELWRPLRPDTICDDFCIGMNVAASGHRLVYEPGAWAEEDTPPAIADEYGRRVRIGIGNFQALCRHPEYLLRTPPVTAFAYFSHKVLRWLAPHLLIVGYLASWSLASDPSWRIFAIVQTVGYALAGFAFLASIRSQGRLPGIIRLPAFLFALNWAFLVASVRFVTGRFSGAWRRSARASG